MAVSTAHKPVYGTAMWTPKGFLSYPALFEAKLNELSGKKAFQANLFIPKDDPSFKGLMDELSRVAEMAFGPQYKKLSSFKNPPVKDGDKIETDRENFAAGCWIIGAKTGESFPPVIIDKNGRPITERREIYGGCIARLLVKPASYKVPGNFGVTLYLSKVQKVSDGEKFGGGDEDIEPPAENDLSPTLRARAVISTGGSPSWSPSSATSESMATHFDATQVADDDIPF